MLPNDKDSYGNLIIGNYTINDNNGKVLEILITNRYIIINGVYINVQILSRLSRDFDHLEHMKEEDKVDITCWHDMYSMIQLIRNKDGTFNIDTVSKSTYDSTFYINGLAKNQSYKIANYRRVSYQFGMPMSKVFDQLVCDIRSILVNIPTAPEKVGPIEEKPSV